MSKQAILAQVTAQLAKLGVPFQVGNGADLTIHNDFVDAGWSTGVRKIAYEASVFLDEQETTAYMWEKTLETGGGFSGGLEGGTSFQSGTTLFRKVKSIQYGPDGKAYEYNLDLGAIPKSVKEAARQSGWKFKTVLKQDKARYPEGYQPVNNSQAVGAVFCRSCGKPQPDGASFCSSCGQEQQIPGQQAAIGSQPKSRSVFNTLAIIAYIGTALVIIGLLAILETRPAGWLIALAILAVSAGAQYSLAKKGCATAFLIWFATTFITLLVCLAF